MGYRSSTSQRYAHSEIAVGLYLLEDDSFIDTLKHHIIKHQNIKVVVLVKTEKPMCNTCQKFFRSEVKHTNKKIEAEGTTNFYDSYNLAKHLLHKLAGINVDSLEIIVSSKNDIHDTISLFGFFS